MKLAAPLTLLPLALMFFVSTLPQQAQSFCIYNKDDSKVRFYVKQVGGVDKVHPGKRFEKKGVYPGENGCCDYQNYDCSDIAEKDYPIKLWFNIYHFGPDAGYDATCPADAKVFVSGTQEDPKFEVTNADGQAVPFELYKVNRKNYSYGFAKPGNNTDADSKKKKGDKADKKEEGDKKDDDII
ncbi:hypothetical protein BDA99DRAFT_536281 [Phascolomyces articulosus]|uniref:Uncharacterized protein n=1 Tax=Phascolomyces articulosus TaxID=60185 RepID=A0AAD5KDH8_9FUNG|nr:hypothetical protein BDA99DRAFT_536281 [Phascolomyces articulosus]